MIIDAHLGLKKYRLTINNIKKQLQQTMTPERKKILITTIKVTFLRWAEKGKRKKRQIEVLKLNPRTKEAPEPQPDNQNIQPPTIHCRTQYLPERIQLQHKWTENLEFFAANTQGSRGQH